MSNVLYKAFGVFALACIIGPPVGRLALTGVRLATRAEAQTYGNVLNDGTLNTSVRALPGSPANSAIRGESAIVMAEKSKTPTIIRLNECEPGQAPLLPRLGHGLRRVPCGPVQQGAYIKSSLTGSVPLGAVQ